VEFVNLAFALVLLVSFILLLISLIQFLYFALKTLLSVDSSAIDKKRFSLKVNLNMAINPAYIFSSSFLKYGGLSYIESAALYLKRTIIYVFLSGISVFFLQIGSQT
jgi:hypothetical protein